MGTSHHHQVSRLGDEEAPIWAIGHHADSASPSKFQNALVAQFPEGSEDGVAVHAKDGREVARWWKSVAGADLPIRNGAPESGPDRPDRSLYSVVKLTRGSGDTMEDATPPTPYLHCPGTAREVLNFYGHVFDCSVQLHTFQDFNRADGPADAIAHGGLTNGPVRLFAADVAGDDLPFRCEGLMFSLLGTADPSTLRDWFSRLSEGGRVVDNLQARPWGASDGQVVDRYGLHWLIGYEESDPG